MMALKKTLLAYVAPDDYEEIANIAWGLDSHTVRRYTGSETVGRASWGTISASVPLCNESADLQTSRHVSDIVDAHYKKHGSERAPVAVAKFAVSMHGNNPALSRLLLQNILDRESDNYNTILHKTKGHYVPRYSFGHVVSSSAAGSVIGFVVGNIWYHIRSGDGQSMLYGVYRCHAVTTVVGIAIGCFWGMYKKHEACKATKLLEDFEKLKLSLGP